MRGYEWSDQLKINYNLFTAVNLSSLDLRLRVLLIVIPVVGADGTMSGARALPASGSDLFQNFFDVLSGGIRIVDVLRVLLSEFDDFFLVLRADQELTVFETGVDTANLFYHVVHLMLA